MGRALLIIDYQNDFCEGGSLAVKGGLELSEKINKLMEEPWDLIVATKDWHPVDHISFASKTGSKPFTECMLTNSGGAEFKSTLWPDHCVQGTFGAEIVEGLNVVKIDEYVLKGQVPTSEFYSAFQDVFKENQTGLDQLLRAKDITEVVIVGLAFDFCVMHTALDAVHAGFHTSIDMTCTHPVSLDNAAAVKQRLKAVGVHLISK